MKLSIKWKLILYFFLILVISCLTLSSISYFYARQGILNNAEKSARRIVSESVRSFEVFLDGQYRLLEAVVSDKRLADPGFSLEEKSNALKDYLKTIGCPRMAFFSTDGPGITADGKAVNAKGRPYFKAAVSGKRTVSDPIVSRLTGKMIYVMAVPVKYHGQITGVIIASRDAKQLNDFLVSSEMEKLGKVVLLDQKGQFIAHSDYKKVLEGQGVTLHKKDPKLKRLADIEQKMIAGKTGFASYYYDGFEKYIAFAPVSSAKWSMGLGITQNALFEDLDYLLKTTIISTLFILSISIWLTYTAGHRIGKPIMTAANWAAQIGKGDFEIQHIDQYEKRQDEIGILASSFGCLKENISQVLGRLQGVSESIFEESRELIDFSQNISTGASEQAANTQQMSASMEELITTIRQNAQNALGVVEISDKVAKDAEKGQTSVNNAVDAMRNITDKINIINDIAKNTDLLALNAAIEAARVGHEGKGFAVVAEEIRKLAGRSQKAASEITAISRTSLSIAEEAGTLINNIVPEIKKTAILVQEISSASQEQDKGVEQVNQAVLILDQVIQQNASASEEMVAMSEELSGQAENLHGAMAFFKVNINQEKIKS